MLDLPEAGPLRRFPARDRGVYALPFIRIVDPLTSTESGPHRKRIARAIFSGAIQPDRSAFGIAARFPSVSIVPGTMQFARTPHSFPSSARQRVNATTAAFDTA
jgi:hypothetical protein